MEKLFRNYSNEIYRSSGYFPAWKPGATFKLGDIILKSSMGYKYHDNIENLGFEIREKIDTVLDNIEYKSSHDTKLAYKAKGNLVEGSNLLRDEEGFIFETKRVGGFYMKAKNVKYTLIDNDLELGIFIKNLFRAGKWDKNWLVINDLASAESATIIISNSNNSKLELKCIGNTKPGTIDIADPKNEFQKITDENMEHVLLGKKNITPKFRIMGLRTKVFSPSTYDPFQVKSSDSFDSLVPAIEESEFETNFEFGPVSAEQFQGEAFMEEALTLGNGHSI